jgi:hypothetical protein
VGNGERLMVVTCSNCQKRFDDEYRWTICPHNSLTVAYDAPYCRYHDLYNCKLDHSTADKRTSHPESQPASIQTQKEQP